MFYFYCWCLWLHFVSILALAYLLSLNLAKVLWFPPCLHSRIMIESSSFVASLLAVPSRTTALYPKLNGFERTILFLRFWSLGSLFLFACAYSLWEASGLSSLLPRTSWSICVLLLRSISPSSPMLLAFNLIFGFTFITIMFVVQVCVNMLRAFFSKNLFCRPKFWISPALVYSMMYSSMCNVGCLIQVSFCVKKKRCQ